LVGWYWVLGSVWETCGWVIVLAWLLARFFGFGRQAGFFSRFSGDFGAESGGYAEVF